MRNFNNNDRDTDGIYRVILSGDVRYTGRRWTLCYGPYTSLTKAREVRTRMTSPTRLNSDIRAEIQVTPAVWTKVE